MAGLIAVTGATGALGSRVAQRLADRGAHQRLVVRDAARAPRHAGAEVVTAPGGYADAGALQEALAGAETLLLVPAAEAADRADQHRSAVAAAERAGVTRIVYVSFQGAAPDATFTLARDHHVTEEAIRASGRPHCLPRMSLYMDILPALAQDGVIRGPAGDGRVAAILRDDLADVLCELLLDDAHDDPEPFDVTGPEALSLAEVAERLTAAGRPTRYEPETHDEALASRAGLGEPWEVEAWVSSYEAIAAGAMAPVSDAVERIAGHAPRTLEAWLAEGA